MDIYRLNLRAVGTVPKAALAEHEPGGAMPDPAERRTAWFGTQPFDTPVYRRDALPAGAAFSGPAIVEQHDRRAAGLTRRGGPLLESDYPAGGLTMDDHSHSARGGFALDPVTFEVLKNAFITTVDQMAEQILRTCYSFVIFNRDFSSALHDADGEAVAQGNQDIAVHVGTLHWTCKDVIRAFKGDMREGDVYAINDPYAGGTHFPDVRLIRPVFVDGEPIAYTQSNGHWSDVGGSVPGSFDVMAKEMFREGIRITPVRLWDAGRFCKDVAGLIAANTRDPASIIGDMQAQAEATRVAEREILRLVAKYGKQTVVTGFADVQDYVERAMRQRLAALPDGEWETQDFIDQDPSAGEGMIPIRVKLIKRGDRAIYDFTGSHPCIGSLYNSAAGATFSAVAAGMKTFFPDLPLNSGFYRCFEVIAPEDTVVSARWPVAVTGFLMPFEKIMNSIYEIWSRIMPERAIACAFNLEYLLTGGRDLRSPNKPIFMFYDWLPGGWGGRSTSLPPRVPRNLRATACPIRAAVMNECWSAATSARASSCAPWSRTAS